MKQLQEDLIKANKKALNQESEQIDAYVKRKGLDVTLSKTGLRYTIYKDLDGENVQENQEALVHYKVSLLDGTECYTTKDKPEFFMVGKDYVESGLHEGIQHMSVGDKAIIIIPSHLGHGLAGDLKKIPIKSTIVYDIELLDIK
ncbi:MAG: FKBP-type peptidyl-prolyl cis-trans isomerase [Vicingaceae bacterium]